MRKTVLAAAAVAITMIAGAQPATAATRLEQRYTALYHHVAKKLGKDTPGRNIRRHGVRTKKGHVRPARDAELARSIRTFRRWLAPPVAPVKAGDGISANPTRAGGAYAIPSYIVMRESGGSYGAYNPTGCSGHGCIGAYQLDAAHFRAGGACAGMSTSPAGQDQCAATLWDGGRGASNWNATR